MANKPSAVLTRQYEIEENQDGVYRTKKMRSIEIKSKTGKPITVLQSEDNLSAIEAVLKVNGWKIISWDGDTASIAPEKLSAPGVAAPAPGAKGCGIGCLLIIVIVAVLSSCVALSSNGKEKEPIISIGIEWACQDAIKAKLNAPSTAKFTQGKYRISSPEPDATYIISGFVESENKIGGVVGASYRCTVKAPTKGDPIVTDSAIIN